MKHGPTQNEGSGLLRDMQTVRGLTSAHTEIPPRTSLVADNQQHRFP